MLIKDGKIAAVGRDVPVPAGAKVIDAEGRGGHPGFISTDVDLAEIPRSALDADAVEQGDYTAGPGDGTRDLIHPRPSC